jgi:hypothetical protein
LLGQFKLYRATGLLFHDHGTFFDAAARDDITYPQGYQVTATQFAVDGQIKQGQVAGLAQNLQPDTNRSDLFGFQWQFLAAQPAWPAVGSRMVGCIEKQVEIRHDGLLPRLAIPIVKRNEVVIAPPAQAYQPMLKGWNPLKLGH